MRTTENKTVSVLIPAYGHCPELPEVIDAIQCATVTPLELIISHSGTANPWEKHSARFPRVKFLHSDQRLFAGAARNRAAEVATGEILAFCDSDTKPGKHWLENLLKSLGEADNRFVVGSVGVARHGGYWGMTNWLFEFSEQAPWHKPREQTGGASCNMILWARDFHSIGGFPTSERAGEDTTLFMHLRETGLTQWLESTAEVRHFNHTGFLAFAHHQFALGHGFAKLRQRFQLPGYQIARFPPLVAILWMVKAWLVVRRSVFCSPRSFGWTSILLPGILTASLIFSSGCAWWLWFKKDM